MAIEVFTMGQKRHKMGNTDIFVFVCQVCNVHTRELKLSLEIQEN